MNIKNFNITNLIRNKLNLNSFLFNPSIAKINKNIYLLSVRSYINDLNNKFTDNPDLFNNQQHSWINNWKSDIGQDVTYIFPILIDDDKKIEIINQGKWPLILPFQDTRIFRYYKLKTKNCTKINFILTFNEKYENSPNMIIKNGDTCDEWCYIIGWSYLIIDINNLNHFIYIPGEKPLCPNISQQVEKNWSLWKYNNNGYHNLLLSYKLSPFHSTFSFIINSISNGQLIGGTNCIMKNRTTEFTNIFFDLENLYDNNLFVSLSTPSYQIKKNIYQAVGHIKIKLSYINKLKRDKNINIKQLNLINFIKNFIKGNKNKYHHPSLIYLMFIYRFTVIDNQKNISYDIDNNIISNNIVEYIDLLPDSNRIIASITHISPIFSVQVNSYDYFLNFPAGIVINKKNTIISYGDGDSTSHLMFLNNKDIDNFLISTNNLKPEDIPFKHGILDNNFINLE
jgi:hypothetical protein